MISVPMFLVAIALLFYSLRDQDGFDMIWRYFAWSNQTLAVFTLWALTVYLAHAGKCYWVTLVPAVFMTMVCSTYLLVAPEGLQLPLEISLAIGVALTLFVCALFFRFKARILNQSKGDKETKSEVLSQNEK